jgi:predicted transcriptional regulator YdeE
MGYQKVEKFNVIGISIRTTNENGQSEKDIPALWSKFMSEGITGQIPNKIDNSVYCIYTEYENDHTKPYSVILGCKVENLAIIPSGMIGKSIEEATYNKYIAKGNILQGMVFSEWVRIWDLGLDRAFTVDFEVYGEKAQDLENAEVDIYVSTRQR